MWMFYVIMVLHTGEVTTVPMQRFSTQQECVAFLNHRSARVNQLIEDLNNRVILRGCRPVEA